LVWFFGLTTASSTIPMGTPYRTYTNAAAVDGTEAWRTPADGNPISLGFYTQNGTSRSPGATAFNSPEAGRTNLTVVPEPSTAALLGFATGLVLLRRRRR
jgi:anti-sigma-K factor RskA